MKTLLSCNVLRNKLLYPQRFLVNVTINYDIIFSTISRKQFFILFYKFIVQDINLTERSSIETGYKGGPVIHLRSLKFSYLT